MNVVITGASQGIGRACVDVFQATGANVIGVDLRPESPADEHVSIDIGSERCADAVVEVVGERPLDALVNSAGVAEYVSAVEVDAAIWDRTMNVNLRGPFLLARALLPNLRKAGGCIVNVASVHAVATSSGISAYAASKGGLSSLSRALAVEWSPDVRVNCVLPGAIDTQMLRDGLGRHGSSIDDLARRHPVQRIGSPAEVAEAVMFLVRSGFITGASLIVDGGATARLSTE